MTKEYIGLNPLKIEGSKFEVGYGYSKFVNLKINGKSYVPILSSIINTFGVDWKDKLKEKVFCKIEEMDDYLSFYTKTTDFQSSLPFIYGAPTIKLGESIWGPSSGFDLGKVKDYKKMDTSIRWDFNVKKGYSDFSYDIWLTKDKKSKNSEKDDVEIMVILSSNFPFPWKKVMETNKFVMQYHNKNSKEWASTDRGHVIVFFLKNKTKNYGFDIKEMIKYCEKYLKASLKDYYIRSIDIINEFSKNTEVEAKLFNLSFDFKK